MIIAGTGHRPEKAEAEDIVRAKVRAALAPSGADAFICGMASGLDLWAGSEALLLGIEVWCAKPWRGHKPRRADRDLYAAVLEGASRVINVIEQDEYPGAWAYQKRNEWMVDNATHILAYWDGSAGGTGNCVKYAKKVGKPVRNIYV